MMTDTRKEEVFLLSCFPDSEWLLDYELYISVVCFFVTQCDAKPGSCPSRPGILRSGGSCDNSACGKDADCSGTRKCCGMYECVHTSNQGFP